MFKTIVTTGIEDRELLHTAPCPPLQWSEDLKLDPWFGS